MKAVRISSPKGAFTAHVSLPFSKSILNRDLIIRALGKGDIEVDHDDPRTANDSRLLAQALADIAEGKTTIDVADAGTAMRFLTAYLTTRHGTYRLQGTERMHRRPIAPLVDALRTIGADIRYAGEEGYPPLIITGDNANGGPVRIDAGVSSQFISALLMIAPVMRDGLALTLTGKTVSRPYIDMTLRVMRDHGIRSYLEEDTISVPPQEITVGGEPTERDWSAAAFWYALLACRGEGKLILDGLRADSSQGDRACVQLFARLGVQTEFNVEGCQLNASVSTTRSFTADCSDHPDLAQALAFCCAAKGIACTLTGLETLRIKETDRIEAISAELAQVGVQCETTHDSLSFPATEIIVPKRPLRTYEDHRMAMAMCCLSARHQIVIEEPEVVSKSYPAFFSELENAGFSLELEPEL